MRLVSWLVCLAGLVTGDYSDFPINFPTTGYQTNVPRRPVGITFVNQEGGYYVIGSSTYPTLSRLNQDSTLFSDVWTETDPTWSAYSMIQGIRWEPELPDGNGGTGVILVTRVDPTTTLGRSALTAVRPSDWSLLWTVELGQGWAFDVDASPGSYGTVFVGDGKGGGLWSFYWSELPPQPSGIFYGNNSLFVPDTPNSPLGFGGGGIYAFSSTEIVVSIAEPGRSRHRFWCVDASPITYTQWSISEMSLAGGLQTALDWSGAIGLTPYLSADGYTALAFVSGPNTLGSILLDTSSGICYSYANNVLTNFNTTTSMPLSHPTNGHQFVAQTFNCDLGVTVVLGAAYDSTALSTYALYVGQGTLPFTEPLGGGGFGPGQDCNSAISVTPDAAGLVYDLDCFFDSRRTNAYTTINSPGVWFDIDTSLLAGTWAFTTRTSSTNYDAMIWMWSACPTACSEQGYQNTPFIASNDDAGNTQHPDCAASSSSYCSEWSRDFTLSPLPRLKVFVGFLSSSAPRDGNYHTASFQVVQPSTPTSLASSVPAQICYGGTLPPPPPPPPGSGGSYTISAELEHYSGCSSISACSLLTITAASHDFTVTTDDSCLWLSERTFITTGSILVVDLSSPGIPSSDSSLCLFTSTKIDGVFASVELAPGSCGTVTQSKSTSGSTQTLYLDYSRTPCANSASTLTPF